MIRAGGYLAHLVKVGSPALEQALRGQGAEYASSSMIASAKPASTISSVAWMSWAMPSRAFATETPKEGQASTSEKAGSDEASKSEGTEQGKEGEQSVESLLNQLKEKEGSLEKLAGQVEQLTDGYKRTLAEMENVRSRAAREVETAKKFATQPLLKSLLDVMDNLERAQTVVPADALVDDTKLTKEKLQQLLKSLTEGVKATENIMLSVLKKHGVERYDPINDKFDPNMHTALFEIPDGSKEAGVVAAVTKRGYKLHDRVIRAAEVGVTRKP